MKGNEQNWEDIKDYAEDSLQGFVSPNWECKSEVLLRAWEFIPPDCAEQQGWVSIGEVLGAPVVNQKGDEVGEIQDVVMNLSVVLPTDSAERPTTTNSRK